MITLTPTYKTATGYDSITGRSYTMNEDYFASDQTAKDVAAIYGTGATRETDMLGPGPFSIDTKMWEFEVEDGRWVNAGVIAAFFSRQPDYPKVADALIRAELHLPPAPPDAPAPPPAVKPVPAHTYIGPRDQYGAYSAAGDGNPAGYVADDPYRPGVNPIIRVKKPGPFGVWEYWIDAPADAVVGEVYKTK